MSAGEAVDCLAKDCWWEGYVHEVFVGYVTVIFPGRQQKCP